MENTRRNFLKKSLIGISGAAIMPSLIPSRIKMALPPENKTEIKTRTLGRTGIKLPIVSMGTGDTNNPKLVKAAYDAGIRFFATSNYYGGGNNEKMLGELFKELQRDSCLIASAAEPIGMDHKEGIFTDPKAGPQLIKDIDAGLKRMKLDYLDIIFLPFAAKRESVFFEPILKVMEDFKKQGKARFIGVTTHSFCDEAVRAAADTGVYDLAMTAYNFRSEKRKELDESIDFAVKSGLGIVAMKTTAGAFWDKEGKIPINTHAAIKWVLNNANITTVVSGMTTFDELQSNLNLLKDISLTERELKDLKFAYNKYGPGLYCRQCHECISQCKHGLDIPTLMRSYMYAYGYRNLVHAKYTVEMTGIKEVPCTSCKECTVQCSMGFDVRNKICDIARLKDVPSDFLRV